MCIRIVKLKEETAYDSSRPLEEQIKGSREVLVDYNPTDSSVDHFLSEVERLCKTGVTASLNIKFKHNNNLSGARIGKQMRKIANGLDLNEFIKSIALLQSEADKRLEEMSALCLKR